MSFIQIQIERKCGMQVRKTDQHDDFDAIGAIYASSWKVAYQGIVPQDYLDALDGSPWASMLASGQLDSFVVTDGETPVGTSSIRAAREESMSGWGELISIYLLPEYWGQGVASPLLEESIRALASAGFRKIYLWVLADNVRAQRFYEKNGFSRNGDTLETEIAGKRLVEVRYVKYLD